MESNLNINEVARRTDLTAYTIRYCERIGLITSIQRAPGGQRRYAIGLNSLADKGLVCLVIVEFP